MVTVSGPAPDALAQEPPPTGEWRAGGYSFSDELGGFRIVGISGSGSRGDPVILAQEIETASPTTIVIRAVLPIKPFDTSGFYASGFIHLRLEALNNSGLPWVEFEFELQEQRNRPSTFGDGLSFDQRRTDSTAIGSSSFRSYSRDFEPYDRLLFREGVVDHGRIGGFEFLISDFTPRWQFFLVQDPRVPAS